MATKKIRELTQAASANDTDVMIIEDAVDTKYITFANLITGIKNKITSVASLATARHIDGMSFNGTADIAHRASCTTAATTVAKTAALSDYALKTGGWVAVNFSSGNTAAAATLNVNSTGAKAIYYKGAAVPAGYIAAGATVLLVYNGTQYDIIGELCQSQIDSLNSNFQTEGASMQAQIDAIGSNLEIEEVSSAYTLANAATGTLAAYKMGSVVFLSGDINLPSTYTTDSVFIFATTTLRPKKNEFISAMRGVSGATGTACRVYMGTNGYLQAYCTAGSSGAFRFSAVYIV